MRFSHLTVALILLPLLCSCNQRVESSYAEYVRLPLAALRQLAWQIDSRERDNFCSRNGGSFLIVRLPKNSLLNEIEIIGKGNTMPSCQVHVLPVGSSIDSSSWDACVWQSDVMPPRNNQWIKISRIFSKGHTFRASMSQPAAIDHVLLNTTSSFQDFEEINFGLFISRSPEDGSKQQMYHTVLLVCLLTCTVIVLLLVSIATWMVVQLKASFRRKGNGDSKTANQYYSDGRAGEFPPDTGIYMT